MTTSDTKSIRLNAHLANDLRRRRAAHETITNLHRSTQNESTMTGLVKVYTPATEDGLPFPPESKKLQLRAGDAIRQVSEALVSLLDTTAVKDYSNTTARADVVVNGQVLVPNAPVTFLLSVEKELRDMRIFFQKFYELDPSQDWTFDAANGIHKTSPVITQKTTKVMKPVVIVPTSDKFPAQVKDQEHVEIMGTWSTTHLSGGISPAEKEMILRRITQVEEAVKTARERANLVEITRIEVGQNLMDFILKG